MRDYNKRIFLSLFWLVVGVVLIALEMMGIIDDFWSGMGAGFIGVGVVQIIRYARYKRMTAIRKKWIQQTRMKEIASLQTRLGPGRATALS